MILHDDTTTTTPQPPEAVTLDGQARVAVDLYLEAHARAGNLRAAADRACNEVLLALGEATQGRLPDGRRVNIGIVDGRVGLIVTGGAS